MPRPTDPITNVTRRAVRSQKNQDWDLETTRMYSSLFHTGKLVLEVVLVAGNYHFWALVWDWTVGTDRTDLLYQVEC
jgi:hypothetical protein